MTVPQAASAFDKLYQKYDAWYENNVLFEIELRALRKSIKTSPLSLEVGTGSGRFAERLEIALGIDPAPSLVGLAVRRGIPAARARAEALCFKKESIEQIFFILSLCFIESPVKALDEAWKVLMPSGKLVIGFVPDGSPWGKYYEKKKLKGHPVYRYASFFSLSGLEMLLERCGFSVEKQLSTLFQAPESEKFSLEEPVEGVFDNAGFVVLVASKKTTP